MFSNAMRKAGATLAGLALASTVGLGVATANAASTATSYVSGLMNTSGSLTQYNNYRVKNGYGSIGLNIDNMTSGYLRLGLIDTSRNQFSDSIQWNRVGYDYWYGVQNGTWFAFQGRMAPGGTDNDWGGTLTY